MGQTLGGALSSPLDPEHLALCFGGTAAGLLGSWDAWCPDVTHLPFTDYSDYGDYWRANYEADYPEAYKYSREQLVEDVEKTFEQVEAGKSSHWGRRVVLCGGGLRCRCCEGRQDLL